MKTILLVIAITCLSFYGCSKKNEAKDTTRDVNGTDSSFLKMAIAANNGAFEIDQIGYANLTDSVLKGFNIIEIAEHDTMKTELRAIANALKVVVPDSLDMEFAALKEQLLTLSGREFDSVYIHNKAEHLETFVTLLGREVQNGNNISLRNFAYTKLPILQTHLQIADTLANHY
jgi:putative membrane protein